MEHDEMQRFPCGYIFDPTDPRAPSVEHWAQMTPAERAEVVAMLPSDTSFERIADLLEKKLTESERLRAEAERQLAEARAEIERLKAR